MRLSNLILTAIGSMVVVTLTHAQRLTDVQKGRMLARQVCAECHAVGSQKLSSPNSAAPSFVSVASTPGMTEMALNVFFQTPHRAMPNLILTPNQKREIITYILTLKG